MSAPGRAPCAQARVCTECSGRCRLIVGLGGFRGSGGGTEDWAARFSRIAPRVAGLTNGGSPKMSVRSSVARIAASMGAACLAVGLMAPVSHAGRASVESFEAPFVVLIDNVVAGPPGTEQAILAANGRIELGCTGDVRPGQFRRLTLGEPPQEGARVTERAIETVDLYLYDGGGLNAPEFAQSVCEGGLTPEPLATGQGLARVSDRFDFVGGDQPNYTGRSTVNGSLSTDDGDEWRVVGRSKLSFSDTDFDVDVSLRITAR